MILRAPPSWASDIRAALARWRADKMRFREEVILLEDGTPFGAGNIG